MKIITILSRIVTVMVLISFIWLPATAQYSVNISLPQNGDQYASVKQRITIHTSHTIDTTCISWPDTSINGERLDNMNVLVLRSVIYDSVGVDSVRKSLYIQGEYKVVNDTVLEFKTNQLDYNTEYVVLVRNIAVFDSVGTPHVCDTVSARFKTLETNPSVGSMSLYDDDEVFYDDTIAVSFTSELVDIGIIGGEVATVDGPILEFRQLEAYSFDSSSGLHTPAYTAIASTSWISQDGKTIYATLDSDISASTRPVLMEVHLSRFTGDTLDDRGFEFIPKNTYSLWVQATTLDGSDTLAPRLVSGLPIGENRVKYGDTISLTAVAFDDGYKFIKWASPEIDSLNNSTSSEITLVLSSTSRLPGVELVALYEEVLDTIHVLSDENGSVLIAVIGDSTYSSDGAYVQKREENYELYAVPDSGYIFSYWDSDDSFFDGEKCPVLQFDGGESIDTLKAIFTLAEQSGTNSLRVYISKSKLYKDSTDGACFPDTLLVGSTGDTATVGYDIAPNSHLAVHTEYIFTVDANGITIVSKRDNLWQTSVRTESPVEYSDPGAVVVYSLSEKDCLITINKCRSSGVTEGLEYTRVLLEREYSPNPGVVPTDWYPIAPISDNGVTSVYNVPSGSHIKFQAYPDENRELHFSSWDNIPSHFNINYPEFSMGIDEDKTVSAIYEDEFRLVGIGYYTRMAGESNSEYHYMPFDDRAELIISDIACNHECKLNDETVVLQLFFNEAVDETSFEVDGEPTIFGIDSQEDIRIDWYYRFVRTKTVNSYAPFEYPIANYNYTMSGSNRIVEFALHQDTLSSRYAFVPKMQKFKLVIATGPNGIKNTVGDDLANAAENNQLVLLGETEMPSLRYELKKVYVWDDQDPAATKGQGDIYMYGAVLSTQYKGRTRNLVAEYDCKWAWKWPGMGTQNIGDDSEYILDVHVVDSISGETHMFPRGNSYKVPHLSAVVYDEDELIFGSVGFAKVQAFLTMITVSAPNPVTPVIQGLLEAIQLTSGELDDMLGYIKIEGMLTKSNWWGARPSDARAGHWLYNYSHRDNDVQLWIDAYLE